MIASTIFSRLLLEGYDRRGIGRVGAQHPEAVKAYLIRYPVLIHREMPTPLQPHVAPIPFVPDQALVALRQLVPQVCHDGGAVMGILPPFFLVQTDNVAPPLDPDLAHL